MENHDKAGVEYLNLVASWYSSMHNLLKFRQRGFTTDAKDTLDWVFDQVLSQRYTGSNMKRSWRTQVNWISNMCSTQLLHLVTALTLRTLPCLFLFIILSSDSLTLSPTVQKANPYPIPQQLKSSYTKARLTEHLQNL